MGMPMSSADKQGGRVVSRVNHIIDRSRSNRVLTRLRVLLRSNEFYLIPLSLVVGVIAGAVVTLMSENTASDPANTVKTLWILPT